MNGRVLLVPVLVLLVMVLFILRWSLGLVELLVIIVASLFILLSIRGSKGH